MKEQKTTLPSFKNIEWKTIKMEMEKIKSSTNTYTNKNITKLNELIYVGAK